MIYLDMLTRLPILVLLREGIDKQDQSEGLRVRKAYRVGSPLQIVTHPTVIKVSNFE